RAPEPPSGLNRLVDRDLQTICLKCLEKDPTRRYASAASLADDLDRWLRGEPIQARPAGRIARLWSWCRRNPVGPVLLGAVAVLAVVLLLGLVFGIIAIAREQATTQAARRRAEDHLRKSNTPLSVLLQRVHDRTLTETPALVTMQRDARSQAADLFR